MGNKISKAKHKENMGKLKLPNLLDHIATKYITTQKFTDLEKLYEKEYCDKLIVLTGDIINKHFNNLEIDFLDQRTKNGIEINKMTRKNVVYLKEDELGDIKSITPLRKKRMCMGIAKFYVKIAHIFAAITKTINPSFTYKDEETGEMKTVNLMEKSNISKTVQHKFTKYSLCSRRIHTLMTRQNNENGIVIKPTSCEMNKKILKKDAFMIGGDGTVEEKPQESILPTIEKSSEPVVENPVEPVLEKPVEPVVEKQVEPVVEKPVEPVLEKPAEPVVEKPAEPVEKPVGPILPTVDKPVDTMLTTEENSVTPNEDSAPVAEEKNITMETVDVPKSDVKETIEHVPEKKVEVKKDEREEIKSLHDEPGIPELENLYYDIFDFNQGIYNSMSKNNKKKYEEDLLEFYKTFTGNKTIPFAKDEKENILKDAKGNKILSVTKFSDIKLKDFHNQTLCLKEGDEKYNDLNDTEKELAKVWQQSHGPKKSFLFKKYANHLAKMIEKSQENEKQLIGILEELFVYWIDPKIKKKTLTINPKIKMKTLEKIVEKTRKIIIKLYMDCENDFQKGLSIFEAIVKKKIIDVYRTRTSNLEKLAEKVEKNENKMVNEDNKVLANE